ncbi:MAG: heme o synthase [Nitrososphaerota archaeon]
MRTLTITETIHTYFSLTKPNVWWLLVFVGLAGYLAGLRDSINPVTLLASALGLACGSAGAESVANYLERDVDALMERTRRRPLPRGLIQPPEKALILGLVLISASLAISALLLNLTALLAMLLGILDYILVYVVLTKRRTAWNIILGSPAGAAPVLVGYAGASGFIDISALILGLLVILWIPSHVWSLALKYKEDYIRAGIPMLPTVVPERIAIRCIAGTVILLLISSLLLPVFDGRFLRGPYLATAAIIGASLLALSITVLRKPSQRSAWILFKFTSPYLAILFLAVMIESVLGLLNAQ